ncbi:lipoyl domain-containing protein [Acidocella sp.]|uniref:lipoyl domain-containing protein n=1 Tax=Acidocella sp. TaxID=50710 RepID=UPI00261FDC8E|nr:lipoyl domain-containing protein [Acidocella sp.]
MPDLLIPRLEMSMTEGDLVEWLVADGATVAEGDPIYTLEMAKATQDISAPAAGVLTQIAAKGQTYEVGTLIGKIT